MGLVYDYTWKNCTHEYVAGLSVTCSHCAETVATSLLTERDEAVALLEAVYDGDMARDHDEAVHDRIGTFLAKRTKEGT